jgi:hypothetical protein
MPEIQGTNIRLCSETMAPNLPESSHQMIRDMIISRCEIVKIADLRREAWEGEQG